LSNFEKLWKKKRRKRWMLRDMESIPRLKKIYATIPESLYNELAKAKVLDTDFDNFVTEALFEHFKKWQENRRQECES
jgi:uncharacterized protein YjiS (DUF1127 family)